MAKLENPWQNVFFLSFCWKLLLYHTKFGHEYWPDYEYEYMQVDFFGDYKYKYIEVNIVRQIRIQIYLDPIL